MAKKSVDSKRRRGDITDDDENPKSKQKTTSSPPTQFSVTSPASIGVGPPPISRNGHPKVDKVVATQALPPPPIDSDDFIPPKIEQQQSKQSSKTKTKPSTKATTMGTPKKHQENKS